MPYDSVSEVLDSQDASISVASPDEFIDLMKECEEYGWHWGYDTKPTYFITAARKLIYPANIARAYNGSLTFLTKKNKIPYSRIKQSGFKC